MTRVVVDASVVAKWLLPQREDEAHVEQALRLIEGLKSGRVRVFQPVHWLAETAAVLVRLSPETAVADIADLYAMDLPIESGPNVYLTACELARSLNQHVFDTLYHAVALTLPDTVLITADARYERAARRRGSIMFLSDLPVI